MPSHPPTPPGVEDERNSCVEQRLDRSLHALPCDEQRGFVCSLDMPGTKLGPLYTKYNNSNSSSMITNGDAVLQDVVSVSNTSASYM